MQRFTCAITFVLAAALGAAGCSSDTVDSDEQARRAYLGLDPSVGESMTLGFAGFNAAQSANIPTEMTNGMEKGTLTITGQVDQGASANKQMRLMVAMAGWSDGKFPIDTSGDTWDITYTTGTTLPALGLSLMNIPTGTLSGTLTGDYTMSGDLTGTVTLDLTITGELMDDGTGKVVRKPGTTTVTGTATDGNGMYMVNVTL